MKKNMGSIDRIIRVSLAIVIFFLYFSGTVTGAIGVVLLIVAIAFIATSTISFCPIYTLFNGSTLSSKK